jgi:4'-phosphopantetheinyl transferase
MGFEPPSFPQPPTFSDPPAGTLRLESSRVDVWRATLSPREDSLRELEGTLSEDERERAGRFRFERDRVRFTAARGTLRALLGRYLDSDPSAFRFRYLEHDKPKLVEGSTRPVVEFNVSHSADVGLFAFTLGDDVGVDVEEMRPDRDLLGIADRFFSRREIESLRAADERERESVFFSMWTRKESYLKARGVGISLSLETIDVSERLRSGVVDLRIDGDDDSASWCLVDLDAGGGFKAALCANSAVSEIRLWSFRQTMSRGAGR